MTIAKRVTQALKVSKKNSLHSKTDNTIKCIEFVKKMESAGVLHPDGQYVATLNGSGREQLKLFALTPIHLLRT